METWGLLGLLVAVILYLIWLGDLLHTEIPPPEGEENNDSN